MKNKNYNLIQNIKSFLFVIAVFCISQAGGWTSVYAGISEFPEARLYLDQDIGSVVSTSNSVTCNESTGWCSYGVLPDFSTYDLAVAGGGLEVEFSTPLTRASVESSTTGLYVFGLGDWTSSYNLKDYTRFRVFADGNVNDINWTKTYLFQNQTNIKYYNYNIGTNQSGSVLYLDKNALLEFFGQNNTEINKLVFFGGDGQYANFKFQGFAFTDEDLDTELLATTYYVEALEELRTLTYVEVPDPASSYVISNFPAGSEIIPTQNSSLPTHVTFSGSYNNLGGYDYLLVDITNAGISNGFYLCTPVTSGIHTFNCSVDVLSNSNPFYTVYLAHDIHAPNSTVVSSAEYDFIIGIYSFGYVETPTTGLGDVCIPFNGTGTFGFNTNFSLFGCFQGALSFLFSPSESSTDRFQTLTLQYSAPFSYLYDMGTLYSEMFSNSGDSEYSLSVTTSLGQINFISRAQIEAVPYVSTIKLIISALLYFYTAMTIYKLLLRAHH